MIIRRIALLAVAFFTLAMAHPFYMSVTDLKFNARSRTLEGSVKIFVNDLEGALRKQLGRSVDLIHGADTAANRKIIDSYLQKRLEISIDGVRKPLAVLGYEQESENIWIYVEFSEATARPSKVEVRNKILYDFLKEQINLVHIDVNGIKKSGKLVNPASVFTAEFR